MLFHLSIQPQTMANLLQILIVYLLVILSLGQTNARYIAAGTDDGSEQWGYVEVRPKAHMFWWLYKSPYRVEDPSNPWPILLWLQGGPGASGVGFGNFMEMGPLDGNLQPRNKTWLKKADLLFVDNPVATGFSYVEDKSLAVTSDVEAATDSTTLLKELFNANETLQKSPLYIFAESYGGKFAVTLGLSVLKAIKAGELKVQLGGVALGNSWISPEDFTFSWGPLLKDVSRIDYLGLNASNRLAQRIQQQIAAGQYEEATGTWSDLEGVILTSSNNVDFYNFMLDSGSSDSNSVSSKANVMTQRYSRYFSTRSSANFLSYDDLYGLMNGPIKKKLKIIPDNVTWDGQGSIVFDAMVGDFMRPRIEEVDELLANGVNVTIYNGQIDLICATKGVESWLSKLKWDGLGNYFGSSRIPLYCGEQDTSTKAFVQSYKNLFFYWILGAGHFVPVEQPCISLEMVGNVTRSPSKSS